MGRRKKHRFSFNKRQLCSSFLSKSLHFKSYFVFRQLKRKLKRFPKRYKRLLKKYESVALQLRKKRRFRCFPSRRFGRLRFKKKNLSLIRQQKLSPSNRRVTFISYLVGFTASSYLVELIHKSLKDNLFFIFLPAKIFYKQQKYKRIQYLLSSLFLSNKLSANIGFPV